jgi:hypothetical protein
MDITSLNLLFFGVLLLIAAACFGDPASLSDKKELVRDLGLAPKEIHERAKLIVKRTLAIKRVQKRHIHSARRQMHRIKDAHMTALEAEQARQNAAMTQR